MKNTTLLIISIFVCSTFLSCKEQKNQEEDIVIDNLTFASKQLAIAIEESEKIMGNHLRNKDKAGRALVAPRTIIDGQLEMVPSRDWTSGFFAGSLWYMYEYTNDEKWKEWAQAFTALVEDQKTNSTTHDMGFKVYCSFGNGLRLTNDKHYKDVALESAYTLITRYQPNAKIIRSWDHGKDKWDCPVIIDNMMNLELLFWAFKESGDSTCYKVAVNHANTTLKNHFRDDYSSYHVIDYDTITGHVLKKNTHQGFAHESAWSRGQAWAVYGYTMCYRETKDPIYLAQAKNIANYIFSHPNLPNDLIPYWDFNAPNIPNEERDVSAATITASALYELSLYDKENSPKYLNWANTILENLTKNYRAKEGGDFGFLLLHSTGSKPGKFEVDAPLSYGDYYFLEALLRKQKLDNNQALF